MVVFVLLSFLVFIFYIAVSTDLEKTDKIHITFILPIHTECHLWMYLYYFQGSVPSRRQYKLSWTIHKK